MSEGNSPELSPSKGTNAATIFWLVVSWLWVGVPLTWGVLETAKKSVVLFK
ncbi:MAG TPA: hypothetical protein VK395_12180 [Gemmataceae bacterium]|nr:hypothetical protein [Gemmataceae bacterium]